MAEIGNGANAAGKGRAGGTTSFRVRRRSGRAPNPLASARRPLGHANSSPPRAARIEALDDLLGGGLRAGTSCLIIGPTGTGKTSLALCYAYAEAERGRAAKVYTFDERLHTFYARAESLGMDVRPHVESGLIGLERISAGESSPGEFAQAVRRGVDDDGARLVVIDSLTDEGGVAITVEQDPAAERVRVQVRDTGQGIAPAFIPHLFDAFRQESMGMDRSHEGSGLGLAITKRLVDLMGGEIEVESDLGEGSAFTVTFPVATAVTEQGAVPASATPMWLKPEEPARADAGGRGQPQHASSHARTAGALRRGHGGLNGR